MARTDNLIDFLDDVAASIKNKKGYPNSQKIVAANFDTEITSIDTLNGEEITITPTTSQQIITPGQGKNAITQATVNAVTSSIDANIVQNNIKRGVTILGVEGNLESDKPDQTKVVSPTTSQQNITPDTGYELASVTINAVTSDIDADIQAENIKKNVSILGVMGTYEGQQINNQDKTVNPTTSQQVIGADTGYSGLGQVIVTGVNSSIDMNIQANNIKKDVTILGVTGTLESGEDLENVISEQENIIANLQNIVNTKAGTTFTVPAGMKFAQSTLTNIPELNTSNVTNMSSMFAQCDNLTSIPNFNTNNVTNMSNMFAYCTNLANIPDFNTSNVTNMTSMFDYCTNLTTVPQLDTSNVTNVHRMFEQCSNLASIPNFNTSKVTEMIYMFRGCSNLTNIPNFNTSNVRDMSFMLMWCSNLTSIPQLDTSNATSMYQMFTSCNNLSNESIQNIVNMCINSNITDVTYKNINNKNSYSPLYSTKFDSTYYSNRLEDLTNAGWKY